MFAVNGPSGPITRHERRAASDQQREKKEVINRRLAEKKRELFFLERQLLPDGLKHEKKKRATQSDIFKGCHIVFNGRTGNVSSYYLAKLVQEHGGIVAAALTTTRVTHMVGLNLNGSKADKLLKNFSKVKFVSPEWILQSIRSKKRKPEFEYLIYKDSDAATTFRAAFVQSTSIAM
ncbi:uncharacterized protein CCR75_002112 [Bremia lactucae]|uniref:BRCT domain-containing protein n=1 Tax=Bremia lactucae TaxID=4779 RepID=A0A976FDA7_BRELC|nr:hypothetical protein CCR75_002112 [Bremia lactucae]